MEGGGVGEDRKKRQMKFQLKRVTVQRPCPQLVTSSVDIHLLSSVRPISSCHKDKSYCISRPSCQDQVSYLHAINKA